jgi:hypothetical protein
MVERKMTGAFFFSGELERWRRLQAFGPLFTSFLFSSSLLPLSCSAVRLEARPLEAAVRWMKELGLGLGVFIPRGHPWQDGRRWDKGDYVAIIQGVAVGFGGGVVLTRMP